MKLFGFLLVGILLLGGGCMRNDDEPPVPQRPISRLYMSFQDTTVDEADADINNIAVIDPADTTTMTIALNYSSGALGGSGIHFNPNEGKVFQSGRYDTLIHMMTVNTEGQLGSGGKFGNGRLRNMRGLAFNKGSNMLYVADITGNIPHLYGFSRPANRSGYVLQERNFRLQTDIRPWSVLFWNDSLLVSNAGTNGGVLLYGNLSQTTDSTEQIDYAPDSRITIEGATGIRGIAFIDSLDVMVLADFGTSTTDGKVYIVEGIKAHLANATGTVTPTRTIAGSSTGLSGPIDVAIDPRYRENGRFIYVADQTTRKVSRFRLSDSGNVEPDLTFTFNSPSRTPFSMFLDARGVADQ